MRLLAVVLLLFSAVNASIKVAVAANVSYAIVPLVETFNQKYPAIKVDLITGSSGKLTAQIYHGAPFDIFMSANMKYPQSIYDKGLALDKPKVYATGSLVLFSKEPLDLSKGLAIVKEQEIKRIALANMSLAPYGMAAAQALKKEKLFSAVKHKLVQGESVAQTVQYTLMAVDIGFIPKSALFSDKMQVYKKAGSWIEVDRRLYEPIEQGAIILKDANTEARLFYDFIFSKQAQKIFADYGYEIPTKSLKK